MSTKNLTNKVKPLNQPLIQYEEKLLSTKKKVIQE